MSDTLPWTDAHNHLHDPHLTDAGTAAPCLINATSEDDWEAVLETAARAPGSRHAALGVHPWFARLARQGWEGRLHQRLANRDDLAIGECGLDRKTDACSLDVQLPVFEAQIRMARELDRALSIHCVGAWGSLLECLKREPPPARWLMHSFNGSAEIAAELGKMGAYFSISGRALHPPGAKILKVFATIAPERILLETDAPNQPPPDEIITHSLPGGHNHPANLAAIGAAIAGRLDRSPERFARLTDGNFQRFLLTSGQSR